MAQSQTNLCNKQPFPSEIVVYEHAQWSAAINALMIHVVLSLSDSPCSVRQRGKGVSERSELAPCNNKTAILTILNRKYFFLRSGCISQLRLKTLYQKLSHLHYTVVKV